MQTVLDAPALLAELDRVGMPRDPVIWAPRGLFSTITLRFRGAPARVWQDPYTKMPDGAHLELYALDLPFGGRPATLQIQCEGMQAAAEIVRTGAGRWEIKALRFDRRPPT